MLTKFILAAAEGEQSFFSKYGMIIVLGVLMVLMVVMSIVPQKKRQKKAQEMMSSIKVGTAIKTIGGFVGVITQINNNDNTFVLDISASADGSNLVKIDKSAVYTVLTPVAEDGSAPISSTDNKATEVFDQAVPADDLEAETKAKEKKAKKKKADDDTSDDNDTDNITF